MKWIRIYPKNSPDTSYIDQIDMSADWLNNTQLIYEADVILISERND